MTPYEIAMRLGMAVMLGPLIGLSDSGSSEWPASGPTPSFRPVQRVFWSLPP